MTELDRFSEAYREAVAVVMPYLADDRLEGLGRHNPGWAPGRHDVAGYLSASLVRYTHAMRLLSSGPHPLRVGSTILDVGGFMGAFPLALSRLGYRVTLSERYDYYDGAFDDLRDLLQQEGVEVLDLDLTETGLEVGRTFDAITNMAMLEHLAHSPKVLMHNMHCGLAPHGSLILEVPNVAYWPKRVAALFGESTLPPLRDVYDAEVPFTGHHREYTAADLRDVLTWSGFVVEEQIAYNYTPRPSGSPLLHRLLHEWPQRLSDRFREVLMARASKQPPG